ncbi:MAG TPA: ring-cleaving dioxygenase, partial [Bacteroidota bacterium]
YYGDELGQPGTILTFFPFIDAVRGKRGKGEVSAVSFEVPAGSFEFWASHLSREGIHLDGPLARFGEDVLSFQDPDGMSVELIARDANNEYRHWPDNPVPKEFAVRRLHGATLTLGRREETDWVLQKMLKFRFAGQHDNRFRYLTGSGASESAVDLLIKADIPFARQSAGSVHHIAWRVADDDAQLLWRSEIVGAGMEVTEILDRQYFRSIYFREPGGVLFEIATDTPGFAVDEPIAELGEGLKLPPWLEPSRLKLERTLPPVELKQRRTPV